MSKFIASITGSLLGLYGASMHNVMAFVLGLIVYAVLIPNLKSN